MLTSLSDKQTFCIVSDSDKAELFRYQDKDVGRKKAAGTTRNIFLVIGVLNALQKRGMCENVFIHWNSSEVFKCLILQIKATMNRIMKTSCKF